MLVAYKFCIFLFFISWDMHIQNLGLFCNLVFVKWKSHSRNQNTSNTIIMLSLSAMTNACLLQKHNAMQWRMTEWVVYTRINAYTFTRDYTGIGCVCSKARAVSKGKKMTLINVTVTFSPDACQDQWCTVVGDAKRVRFWLMFERDKKITYTSYKTYKLY